MKTPQELKCIRLMNAELFEDEPHCNISLLSKHLFDVCGAPYKCVPETLGINCNQIPELLCRRTNHTGNFGKYSCQQNYS